jgi:predicted MFS family arabinose efflux permease
VFFSLGVLGVLAFAAALPGFRGVKEKPSQFDLVTTITNYGVIFRNPLAKICFSAVFLEALFMYGVFPHIATMMHNAGETRASIAGVVIAGFGIGGALYSVLVSRLLPLLGERWMMRIGGMTLGFCLVVIAAALPWPVEFANFILLGFGFYMLHAVIQIYASELAPAARAASMALHSFFFFLGQAAGPIFYGAGLSSSLGIGPLLLVGAGVLVGVGWTCAQWLRRAPAAA